VNGDLARCESRWVKPASIMPRERDVASRPHPSKRERTGARPRMTRECHSAARPSQKRCAGRGTGAVRATGSYEGSLPIEGILDHREASAFTRRRGWWFWRPLHPPTRLTTPKAESDGQIAALTKVGEARGRTTGGRDRGARGSVASAPWEENAHAPHFGRKRATKQENTRSMTIRRSGLRTS